MSLENTTKWNIVGNDAINTFQDRVPAPLIVFWKKYGWDIYKEGYLRICDPRPFDSLLWQIFSGDPYFNPSDMKVVGYTAFNTLRIWNRKYGAMLAFMEKSEIPAGEQKCNPDTGKPYSKEFLCDLLIYDDLSIEVFAYYKKACKRLGRPANDEVFGYAPALQLGGEWGLENLHRFKAIEHMTFLVQLGPFTLTEVIDPLPDAPSDCTRNVRRIGL